MDPYNGGALAPWQFPKHIRRQQSTVLVSSNITRLLGPNPGRVGAIFSMSAADFTSPFVENVAAGAVSTAAGGIKLSFTSPSSFDAKINGASFVETTGTGVIAAFQLVRGGTTFTLASFTTQGFINGPIQIRGGDTVQWNVTTPIGASVSDFWMGVADYQNSSTVTITLDPSGSIDSGINISSGNPPFVLWKDVIGDSLTEDIFAVTDRRIQNVTVWDLFY